MNEYLQQNSLYLVMIIVVIIWAGMSIFLFSIDRKVNRLEKQFQSSKEQNSN